MDREKIDLEKEMLRLEVREKQRPFYKKPSQLVSVVSIVVAFSGVGIQCAHSKREYTLANIKVERAYLEAEKTEKRLNEAEKLERIYIERLAKAREELENIEGNVDKIRRDTTPLDTLQDKQLEGVSRGLADAKEAIDILNVVGAKHLALGKPQAVYERIREGYAAALDPRLKILVWVQYELSRDDLRGQVERSDDFRPDFSVPFIAQAQLADYAGSGFDRGHLVPSGDMRRSEKIQSESFLLSNIAPQVGIGFNRHIWVNLESAVRGWVAQRGPLTIITGPIFTVDSGSVTYRVIGNNHVAVPTAFYKIVVDYDSNNQVDVLAFVLPNENLTGHTIDEYLVTVDEIEAATGLDFLTALPDNVERDVEARIAQRLW